VRRRDARGGGGLGRENAERAMVNARRNRREPGDKPVDSSEDQDPADGSKPSSVEASQSDKGICTFRLLFTGFFFCLCVCLAVVLSMKSMKFGCRCLVHRLSELDEIWHW